jgi:hypothetical protein
MKETFYFSHDYNTRQDIKIKKLLQKHGMAGYGIFWCIVEDLYNNANALPTDYEGIAYELRTDCEVVKSIIKDFDLFVFNGEMFGSLSIQSRLDKRAEKSQKARESAKYRWEKEYENANALQTHSEGNAIKERKGKEIKGKETKIKIDERKLKFASTLEPFLAVYGKEMLNDFYKYWTEPNKTLTKFRQEMEKTWDVELRLKKWANNDKNFKKSPPSSGQPPQNKITHAMEVAEKLGLLETKTETTQIKLS